jgi:RNA polymerase sigma-70 factor (ECF subfamily)
VSIDSIDPTRIRAWLLAAARNKMIDRYRRTDRFVPLDDTLVVMDPDEGPAGAVLRKQEAQELRRVIAEMSPRDARLLELYYFDERPLADVAEMTGTSTMAAKVALFRARRRLRRALETGEAR